MRLSRETHQKLESFFCQCFEDSKLKLPEIEIYARGGARLLTSVLSVDGLTLGRRIFIKPDLARRHGRRNLCVPKILLAHEIAHVLQYQKLGFFRFLYTYFKSYFRALKNKKRWNFISRGQAYLEIPHEVEARQISAEFIEWTIETKNGKGKTEN